MPFQRHPGRMNALTVANAMALRDVDFEEKVLRGDVKMRVPKKKFQKKSGKAVGRKR